MERLPTHTSTPTSPTPTLPLLCPFSLVLLSGGLGGETALNILNSNTPIPEPTPAHLLHPHPPWHPHPQFCPQPNTGPRCLCPCLQALFSFLEGSVEKQLKRLYPVRPERADAWLAGEIARAATDPGALGVFRCHVLHCRTACSGVMSCIVVQRVRWGGR